MSRTRTESQADAAPFSDRDAKARAVELLISDLLRIGVLTSLAVVIFGTIVSFIHHPGYVSESEELRKLMTPGAAFPHTMSDVFHGLRQFSGQAIIMVGLLLLIATPVLRVGVSIFAFVYEKDRRYVVITTIVFLLLILSFVLGKVE
jgi:uncharacterized membrane protein